MKLAVAGNGGAGKTTLAGLPAYTLAAAQGRPVLAIDADPAPALGVALGFPEKLLATLRPIAEMTELAADRTGGELGDFADYFKRNPRLEEGKAARLSRLRRLPPGGAVATF
jgi:CO dehydrogenase maturation factor